MMIERLCFLSISEYIALLGSGDENKLLRKELLKYQTQKQGRSNGKKTKVKYGRFPSYSK
jgi:hypothetical protein